MDFVVPYGVFRLFQAFHLTHLNTSELASVWKVLKQFDASMQNESLSILSQAFAAGHGDEELQFILDHGSINSSTMIMTMRMEHT